MSEKERRTFRSSCNGTNAIDASVPIVILNTHHTGLGIARSLAPLGPRVIALTANPVSPGNRSRHHECRIAPDSLREPQLLIEFLIGLREELKLQPILLPTRDHDIHFINHNRDVLDGRYHIPFASPEVIDRVMNKDRLFDVARRVGIRVPNGLTLRSRFDLDKVRELRFPCICKPLYASQWRQPGIWEVVGRQKAVRLDNEHDLRDFYLAVAQVDPVVTVQEWIAGDESDLQIFGSYCGSNHEVQAWFSSRKRLQYPELVGTGIVVEALPIPELELPSRRLLRGLEYSGISEIEFKRDRTTGVLYLIEVNPRHWDQHRLGSLVGVNLSEALYRDVTRQSSRTMRQSEDTALWIAEVELARHIARCVVGRARWRTVRIGSSARRTWSVFDLGDLRPFLSLCGVI